MFPEGRDNSRPPRDYYTPLEAFVFGEVNERTTEEFKRKLTAIYSADVAGYRWGSWAKMRLPP